MWKCQDSVWKCIHCFRPRPQCAGKFKNAALFLRLGLPFTLIRHESWAFRKRCSNRRNFKRPALSCSVNILKTELFENASRLACYSLLEFSSNTHPNWLLIVAFCVYGIHLIRFQRTTAVFKFPRRIVAGRKTKGPKSSMRLDYLTHYRRHWGQKMLYGRGSELGIAGFAGDVPRVLLLFPLPSFRITGLRGQGSTKEASAEERGSCPH